MSDEHGLGTEHVDGGAYIVHVIGDGTRVQRLRQGAGTMAAQADRDGTETFVGEKVQEMLIPSPCGQVSTVDEQQRRRVLIAAPAFVNHFEHWSVPRSRSSRRNGR